MKGHKKNPDDAVRVLVLKADFLTNRTWFLVPMANYLNSWWCLSDDACKLSMHQIRTRVHRLFLSLHRKLHQSPHQMFRCWHSRKVSCWWKHRNGIDDLVYGTPQPRQVLVTPWFDATGASGEELVFTGSLGSYWFYSRILLQVKLFSNDSTMDSKQLFFIW